MRLRVGRDALTEAVTWVARSLPARPVIPVLSGLLLQAGQDGLTVSCFDYEVSALARIDAEVTDAGAALMPGRLLAEIARSLPAEPVELSLDAEMVALTCGSADFMLVSLPLAEYPPLPEPPPAAGLVDAGALAVAAAQVLPAVSRDDTVPMLTGVCLDVTGPALTLAATDRYRMAVRELAWQPAEPGIRATVVVPARTLAEAARSLPGDALVEVAFGAAPDDAALHPGDPAGQGRGDAQRRATDRTTAVAAEASGIISFSGSRRRLTARLIGGEYIGYRSRFPAEFSCRADLPAGRFVDAVRRVSLVAERDSPVRLEFTDEDVLVSAGSQGRARAAERVPAAVSGDERVISFSPHYLLDGLAAAMIGSVGPHPDGSEAANPGPGRASGQDAAADLIRLDFTSAARPALISRVIEQARGAANSPAFRYLVVPLRAPVR